MARVRDVLQKSQFRIICLELVVGVFSLATGIVDIPFLMAWPTVALICGAQVGFCVISIVFIAAHLMDKPPHKCITLAVSIAGCIAWLAAGAAIVLLFFFSRIFAQRTLTLVYLSGFAAINNAFIYLADAIFQCCRRTTPNMADGQKMAAVHNVEAQSVEKDSAMIYSTFQ